MDEQTGTPYHKRSLILQVINMEEVTKRRLSDPEIIIEISFGRTSKQPNTPYSLTIIEVDDLDDLTINTDLLTFDEDEVGSVSKQSHEIYMKGPPALVFTKDNSSQHCSFTGHLISLTESQLEGRKGGRKSTLPPAGVGKPCCCVLF
mmetsp:Transcript_33036/g.58200  ORF Transcript_33036/g.58200 Transcript_33036/m.58200 type:complete len:147 (-) Transcript_33036:1874-2314(-)